MKLAAALSAGALALSGPSGAQTRPAIQMHPYTARYVGPGSCGAWSQLRGLQVTQPAKAVPLNWILGYLSGRAAATGFDLLDVVDIESASVWIDNYCQANPLDFLGTAAARLGDELERRAREQH